MTEFNYTASVERWGQFEVRLAGPAEGNPFTDHRISANFTGPEGMVKVCGFYDGDGRYAVRFMPSYEGEYRFTLQADFLEKERQGSFTVTSAQDGNHGPVRTSGCHFVYEDGTPYYSVGTTCYVWELQSDERIEQTLHSLEDAGFNKIRFCIFPKHYDYNLR